MEPVVVPPDRLFLGLEAGPDGARDPLLLRRDELVTHGVILGRTGSGKTGLGAVLVEELALSGVPVLVVDPKGDMTNLALTFPGLTAADLKPWVGPERDAADEAARWRRGLEGSGQAVERVAAYRDAAQVTVYAPGWVRSGDVPRVDLWPSLRPPRGLSDEGRAEQARGLVSAILGAAGLQVDSTDPRHVFVSELVVHRWSRGQDASVDGLVAAVQEPPLESVGPMALDRFLPPSERDKLARALVAYARSAGRWHGGTPLDMDVLLARPGAAGPARVSVFTIAHLEPDERMFFVTLLLETLLGWLAEQPGTTRLRALLAIEEARGLLPPHPANPPSKAPLARLIAQARAFGVGVVLSTQHPVDLDYKALSNVGTWFLGGLRERDLQRDLASELRDRGIDEALLGQLEKRTFLAVTPEAAPRTFGVRWALSYLRGPIAPSELSALSRLMAPPPGDARSSPAAHVAEATAVSRPQAPTSSARSAATRERPTPGQEPRDDPADGRVVVNRRGALPVDPWAALAAPLRATSNKPFHLGSVPVVHGQGPEKNATWRPSLVGLVHLTFSRPRLTRAFEAELALALPLVDGLAAVDWARALHVDPARLRPGAPTGWHRFEEIAPAAVSAAFGWKAFQQAKRDLEVFVRERLVWACEADGEAAARPAAPVVVAPIPEGTRREALRTRLGGALAALTGAPLGADLQDAALEWLLGAESPLAAAAGRARLDAANAWQPPSDAGQRLERLVATLRAVAPDRAASTSQALTASTAPRRAAAELLGVVEVRVDQVGLLWTAAA